MSGDDGLEAGHDFLVAFHDRLHTLHGARDIGEGQLDLVEIILAGQRLDRLLNVAHFGPRVMDTTFANNELVIADTENARRITFSTQCDYGHI